MPEVAAVVQRPNGSSALLEQGAKRVVVHRRFLRPIAPPPRDVPTIAAHDSLADALTVIRSTTQRERHPADDASADWARLAHECRMPEVSGPVNRTIRQLGLGCDRAGHAGGCHVDVSA